MENTEIVSLFLSASGNKIRIREASGAWHFYDSMMTCYYCVFSQVKPGISLLSN